MTLKPTLRHVLHGAIVALTALATTGVMAATASAATPAGHPGQVLNQASPAYQHTYRHGAVPTRATATKMAAWAQAHPAVAAASANDLNYGGGIDGIGVTTGHEQVYLVFYGSQWGTASTNSSGDTVLSGDASGVAPRLQEFFKGLGTGSELWSGVLTQYCEGVAAGTQICPTSNTSHVAYPTGGALSGVWVDESTASPSAASGHQLGVEALNASVHFGNTTAAANRNAQYVIVSPHGANPDNYQTQGFCAWHDYNGDTTLSGGAVSSSYDFSFTNLPYIPDAGASCGQNFVNSNGPLDGVTIVEGHEYAETVTDQNPAGGYTDNSGEENGDKCAWITPGTAGGSFDLTTSTGTFAVQTTWGNDGNNNAGTCQASHAIVSNGGGGNTITVTNPGNQTGTVGTAVSLQIHATDSASGQTLTYTATGLPAGLSISSSGLISGTPNTAATSSVTVTARDTTGATGSASFSWIVNPQGGGGCTAQQLLGNPGFETGAAAPWTLTAGVLNNSPSEPPHSGSWDAWLDGYGTTHTDSAVQTVAVPAGCTTYTGSFWLHIDTSETTTTTAFDTLKVQVLNSSNTVLATLATFSNLNHASGYQQHSYNLSAYAGQTIKLKFTGTEDVSLQTSFVVDDTAINVS
jgi:serine protease